MFKCSFCNRIDSHLKWSHKKPAARVLFLAAVMAFTAVGCSAVNEDVLPDSNGVTLKISPDTNTSAAGDDTAVPAVNSADADFNVYDTLSDTEKAAYDSILNAVMAFEPYAKLPDVLEAEDIKKLFTLIYSQESNIFWLSNIYFNSSEPSDTLNLNYRYNKDTSDIMRGELELAVGTILGSLPENCTAYEAVKCFHNSIITFCSFSSEKEHVNSAYGALVDGYAQCEGYAFAMSLLCDRAGIQNFVACGKNDKGASHAWNKININGYWYNVDCTWDDPILKYENKLFLKHDYLLVADNEIINITHFPDNKYFTSPECYMSDINFFNSEGILFNTADEGIAYLREKIKTQALSSKREVEFRLTSRDEYDYAVQVLFDNNKVREIIEDINGSTGAGIKSAYKYNNEDLLIIHLSLIFDKD